MGNPVDHLRWRTEAMGVEILLAAEVGSRAFGTEGPGSDHDVIAVVVSPAERYVSLSPPGATYGAVTDADVTSTLFDVRRAVDMAASGNVVARALALTPPLVDVGGLAAGMAELAEASFVQIPALRQYRNFLDTAMSTMTSRGAFATKAWLHALQPMLSFRFVEREGMPPPVPFADLVAAEPDRTLTGIARATLAAKRAGVERIPEEDGAFVFREASRIEGVVASLAKYEPPSRERVREAADALLARVILGGAPSPSP